MRVLQDVRGGVRGGQRHRDDEVGGREAEQARGRTACPPPRQSSFEHGDRAFTVRALARDAAVDRQGADERQSTSTSVATATGAGRQCRDPRLVAERGEVVDAGQAHDPPPGLGVVLFGRSPVRPLDRGRAVGQALEQPAAQLLAVRSLAVQFGGRPRPGPRRRAASSPLRGGDPGDVGAGACCQGRRPVGHHGAGSPRMKRVVMGAETMFNHSAVTGTLRGSSRVFHAERADRYAFATALRDGGVSGLERVPCPAPSGGAAAARGCPRALRLQVLHVLPQVVRLLQVVGPQTLAVQLALAHQPARVLQQDLQELPFGRRQAYRRAELAGDGVPEVDLPPGPPERAGSS